MARQVVIAGGGFAGLAAGLELARLFRREPPPGGPARILLVDPSPWHTLRPKIPEAIGGRISCRVQVPFARITRRHLGLEFLQDAVEGVDWKSRRVRTTMESLPFDDLILAVGSRPHLPANVPGLREHALTVWDFDGACSLRRAMELRIDLAGRRLKQGEPPAAIEPLLRFVVIGGGFVGVEVAAHLKERGGALARRAGLPVAPDVVLVEAAPRVLPRESRRVSRVVAGLLARQGVRIHLGSGVREVKAGSVILADGTDLHAATAVWAGGVTGHPLLRELGLAEGVAGRVPVRATLEAVRASGVWVVGDAAWLSDGARNQPVEPAAHVALAQGRVAAYNLWAKARGRPLRKYVPDHPGLVLSLGRRAVFVRGVFTLSGPGAALAKQVPLVAHVYRIGGGSLLRSELGPMFLAPLGLAPPGPLPESPRLA